MLAGRVRCQTHNENNNKWNRTYNKIKRKRTEINELKEVERGTCQRVHNAHPDLAIEPNHVDLKGKDKNVNVVLKLDPSNFKMLPESKQQQTGVGTRSRTSPITEERMLSMFDAVYDWSLMHSVYIYIPPDHPERKEESSDYEHS